MTSTVFIYNFVLIINGIDSMNIEFMIPGTIDNVLLKGTVP